MPGVRAGRSFALAAAVVGMVLLPPAHGSTDPLDPPVTSCGGSFLKGQPAPDDDGYCEFDFAGFPIHVEATWTFDQPKANPQWVTDVHAEIVMLFGPPGTTAPIAPAPPTGTWIPLGSTARWPSRVSA